MADFEIVDEPNAQSQFEVVDEPQFEVEPSKSDWAKNITQPKAPTQTPSLPRGAGIRVAPQEQAPVPAKKPFHPGQILDYVNSSIDPEVTKMALGEPPKPTVDDSTDWHPGKLIGRLGDAARELFHDAASTAIDTVLTPMTFLAGPMVGKSPKLLGGLHGPNMPQGPMPLQGPPELIGPPARNLGQPADLGNLIRPTPRTPTFEPTITELAQDSQLQGPSELTGAFSEGMLTSPMRRSPESIQGRPGPGMVSPQTEALDFPTTTRDRARYNKEMTTEFEKPGFLRTAEEKLQDRNPLRPAEEMAPTGPAQARAFERSRRELEVAEADRQATLDAARKKLRKETWEMDRPVQEMQGPKAPQKKPTEFMQSPVQAGFTMDPSGNVVIGDSALPSGANRAVHNALETLGQTGPTGQALKSALYGMDDYARQGAATNFADWVREIQQIYPVNKKPGILRDPRREWSVTDYINIEPKEYEALMDLWYSEGKYRANYDKLDPAAKLRVDGAYPTWKTSFGRASSDPGVQQTTVRNTVTGEVSPLGSPSSFIPHQYRGGADTGKFSKTLMKRIYQQYAKNTPTPMTESEFFETFRKRAQGYESIANDDGTGTRWVQSSKQKRFLGVEEARLFDAEAVAREEGKSILQVMKEHGLETDVVKLQLRYNLGALHRGQQALHKTNLDRMWANWREEVGQDPFASAWGTKLEERYQGLTVHDEIDRANADWLQKAKGINALTLLSRATVAASNQFFTYGLAKPTWRGLLDRAAARVVAPAELDHAKSLIPDSGALLANFNQEMNRIDGLFGAWSMAQLRLTGFNYLDRLQRGGAAKIGYFYARDLGRKLMRDPSDKVTRTRLAEDLRLNPDEVLASMKTEGQLSDALAKRAMQVYADMSMGTTGVRGKPLWALSDHWAPQLMLNLRGQLVSNMTEAYRMIRHAPTIGIGVDKAARLLLGATIAGTMTKEIGAALRGQDTGVSSKDLAKRIGDEGAAYMIESIAYGLGTIATDTALSMVAPGDDVRWKFANTIIGTPMTQIGRAANLYKSATEDPLRGVLKTVPFPVPLDKMAESAGLLDEKKKRRNR